MSLEFWSVMHDGTIEGIAGQVPGDIVLTIGIEYLCEQLLTTSDTLSVILRGCRLLAYTPFDEATITDLQRIAEHEVEILSAVARADGISVCCTNGSLDLEYASVEVRTIEGVPVSQGDLEAAANRAVSEWLRRNRDDQAT